MAERDRAPYTSRLRSEQARATRRTIVAAASDLFVEKGYAATTIDAVAERAVVGRKTVFSSVGGKDALLKLAWDWAVVGDDESVPMAERPQSRPSSRSGIRAASCACGWTCNWRWAHGQRPSVPS